MNWICRGAIKTQEFGGMYCAIVTLKWGSFLSVFIATLHTDKVTCFDMYCLLCSESVVSAAMFRIYGAEVAELPLVATSADCQGQVSLVLLSNRCVDVWNVGLWPFFFLTSAGLLPDLIFMYREVSCISKCENSSAASCWWGSIHMEKQIWFSEFKPKWGV